MQSRLVQALQGVAAANDQGFFTGFKVPTLLCVPNFIKNVSSDLVDIAFNSVKNKVIYTK